ncbi:MAG: hypothetical protein WCA77_02065 [Thermoplasmata archaeon]
MGLPELFVAGLVAGVSAINSGVPIAVWLRTREGRFLLVSGASLCLMVLGILWAWAEVPSSFTPVPTVPIGILLLTLSAAVLLLAASLWPRHT